MYEHRTHALLPWRVFLRRAAMHTAVGGGGVLIAVGIGTLGYHFVAQLPWVDAFLDASMILSGMGPVNVLRTTEAKVFAALYALFSGLVFVGLMGIVLAPWAHRILHRFHMDEEETTNPSAP